MNAQTAIQLLIGGLAIGFVYSLVALGVNLLFNASGLFNFAQGEFVMLGAVLMFTFYQLLRLPFLISLVLAILAMSLFGLVFENRVAAPLRWRKVDPIFTIVATIALSLFLREAVRIIWGTQPRAFPNVFGTDPLQIIPGVFVMPHTLWILGITVVLMVALQGFFTGTNVGTALRATAQNRDAAALMGVNVNGMVALTFGLNGTLTALAGILLSPLLYVTPDMGLMVGTKAFAAVIIGGFGNTFGALAGGAILGVVETLGAAFISSENKDAITFILLVFFLLFKPEGLFRSDTSEKV